LPVRNQKFACFNTIGHLHLKKKRGYVRGHKLKSGQLKLLKDEPKAYGGELRNTRHGRSCARPLDTRNTMHLVLRSSQAVNEWSFWRHKNKIRIITAKFSHKYGISVVSMANVGNHLHFQIKLSNRFTYNPFIRALTSAIAMAVTKVSRWNQQVRAKTIKNRFWDNRPFTRVVVGGINAFLALKNYILINQCEGFGLKRQQAKFFLAWNDLLKLKARPN
jgi:REP element-mobilizing transposase RayT